MAISINRRKEKCLILKKINNYLRWYSCLEDSTLNQWWFNTETCEIVHNEVVKWRNLSDDDSVQKDKYIPMPRIDIIQMEKDFLDLENLHPIIYILQNNINSDFDCEFKKYIDYNHLFNKWHNYEANELQKKAISWCIANKIPYSIKSSD